MVPTLPLDVVAHIRTLSGPDETGLNYLLVWKGLASSTTRQSAMRRLFSDERRALSLSRVDYISERYRCCAGNCHFHCLSHLVWQSHEVRWVPYCSIHISPLIVEELQMVCLRCSRSRL